MGARRDQRPAATDRESYPVAPNHFMCLARDTHPLCRDDYRARWVLATAILVEPRVDMRRLRQTSRKLFDRHDCLRIRFSGEFPEFRATIAPNSGDHVREVELGDVDDVTFKARVGEIARQPIALMESPLAEFVVVHCGARGDVVIWRCHHAITDGQGMLVLSEDFLKLLVGLPLTTRALSYGDYVARYLTLPPDRAARIEGFWQEMHCDLPKAPEIGRKAKGLEPLWTNMGVVIGKRRRFTLTGGSLKRLADWKARSGLGANSLLFAGFLDGLCQLHGVERLVFTTLIGRSDPGLASYGGTHYFDPVLPFDRVAGRSMEETAQELHALILQASEHLPSDAASQSTPHEEALIRSGVYPRQFSVHQPRPQARARRSLLQPFFRLAPGQTQQIGPYQISPIDVSIFTRSRTDLRLATQDGGESPAFDLEYDGISYTDEEVERLGEMISLVTGLDLD